MRRTIQSKVRTSWEIAAARSVALPGLLVALAIGPALAQEASPTPPGNANCALVSAGEAGDILGYAVSPADEASSSGGICFFTSRAMSEDGSVSYAIVDAGRLAQRRAYYAVLARKCAGVQATAPRAFSCKTYVELSQAQDLASYYASRTDFPTTTAVKGLGPNAVAAGDTLYVKRGDVVYEVVVKRGDTLDIDRSTMLAKLLLARTPAPKSTPAPSPSPSPSPRSR